VAQNQIMDGSLAGKNVLVMGLGRFGGGVGVAKWLVAQGAVVTVNDAAPADKLTDSLHALDGLPISFKLGGHDVADFLAADLIVVNPAVDRRKSEVLQAAEKAGVALTSEMNLFLSRCQGITVGITGSVGKSTTTAFIYEALKAALGQTADRPAQESPRVFLGGNIGRSLLLDLPSIRPQDYVVLELSSFMLEETPQVVKPGSQGKPGWSPHVAVVTNVFANHLDRHGTMAAYASAKQNILRHQGPGDVAILNNDHDLVSRWVGLAESRGTRVVKFSTRGPADKRLKLVIPGEHNASNAAAAIAVVEVLASEVAESTFNRDAARQAIMQFSGLAHRLQLVHTWNVEDAGGSRVIRFYNDSKATSPDASITALQAFAPGTAIFFVGGYDKHIDLSAFTDLLANRVAGVIGIGQTGEALVKAVEGAAGTTGELLKPRTAYAGTLEVGIPQAMGWALADSRVEAIVLSPASASWGQFANYEARGERFAALARSTAISHAR
jgi:UDP-N-acetylmuramoylalanine--D-glutamate ligase